MFDAPSTQFCGYVGWRGCMDIHDVIRFIVPVRHLYGGREKNCVFSNVEIEIVGKMTAGMYRNVVKPFFLWLLLGICWF